MTRNKEQMQAIAKALEELDRNGFWEDRPHVTPGEYEPLPGLYRRWEIEMALLPGVDLRIEEAGRTEDGADLYEVYTRKAS